MDSTASSRSIQLAALWRAFWRAFDRGEKQDVMFFAAKLRELYTEVR